MKIAVIDLGTNTFNIFVAEVHPDLTFRKLYKSKISVKLGEGGINHNFIEEEPFRRGIRALKQHRRTIRKFGVEKVFAFATSGIRSASNGADFVNAAKKMTGIDINVITGDEEAELIYYGVRSAVKMTDQLSLIIDIGGGSTEFIIADKDRIHWKQSFLLGAARLLERFVPSDPIKASETKRIEQYLEENLHPLFKALEKHPVTELIGSAGSFDSLAEMIAYRFHDISILKGKTEYSFNLHECDQMYELILSSTARDRLHMKGLTRMRVDMIVVSAVFVDYIMMRLGLKKMRLSRFALKEGALWHILHTHPGIVMHRDIH